MITSAPASMKARWARDTQSGPSSRASADHSGWRNGAPMRASCAAHAAVEDRDGHDGSVAPVGRDQRRYEREDFGEATSFVPPCEQVADGGQREAPLLEAVDVGQADQVVAAVVADPADHPGRGEEAPRLVGPDVAGGGARPPGQLVDGHRVVPVSMSVTTRSLAEDDSCQCDIERCRVRSLRGEAVWERT